MAGLSFVLVVLIAEGFLLWWMTKYSVFRLFLWAICSAATWPAVLSLYHGHADVAVWLTFGCAVWTLTPPVGWYLRRRQRLLGNA